MINQQGSLMPGRWAPAMASFMLLVPMHVGLLGGCRTATVPDEKQQVVRDAQVMTRTELFFGLTRPNGGPEITDAEFQSFLEQHVTPRFPDGYTIVPGEGRWRSGTTTIREPSRILIILAPRDETSAGKIQAIRDAYVKQFNQEAVLRVEQDDLKVSF